MTSAPRRTAAKLIPFHPAHGWHRVRPVFESRRPTRHHRRGPAWAIAATPVWAFAPSLAVLVAGAFLMPAFVQGARGVIPAHITELSPDSLRGFLPGFAHQCGAALAGAIAYLEARLAERVNYAWALALIAATVCALGVMALGPERRGVAFGRGGL